MYDSRANVDARIARLVEQQPENTGLAQLLTLGLHRAAAPGVVLTDVKHLLAQNALDPAYSSAAPMAGPALQPAQWVDFHDGVAKIGFEGGGFCFDNELPRHRVFVEPFSLSSRLATNGEYLAFIEARGYRDPSLGLSEGGTACVRRARGILYLAPGQRRRLARVHPARPGTAGP